MKKSPIKNMAYWKGKNQATPIKFSAAGMAGGFLGGFNSGKVKETDGRAGAPIYSGKVKEEKDVASVNLKRDTAETMIAGNINNMTSDQLDEKVEEKVNEVVNQKTGEGLV